MNHKSFLLASLLAASLMPAVSAAQGVSLASGFTDFTTWSLYGSATVTNQTPGNGFTYSTMYLTQGIGGEAGAGFAPAAIALDYNQAFTFDFHFGIPPSAGLRGDGMTFTLAGAPGVGFGGSDLGYGGLGSDSVAFAIDTFHFGGEPVSPSVQILQSGSVTPLAYTETGLGDSIRDPNFQWYAHVDYTPSGFNNNAGTLTGTIEHLNLGTFSVAATIDFAALGMAGNPVYYGFTASNGLATDEHYISSAAAVPVPAAVWLLGSGLLGLVSVARRNKKRSQPNEHRVMAARPAASQGFHHLEKGDTMKHAPWLIGCLMLGAFGFAQAAVTVTVTGDANPWLAGMPSGSTASGDSVPQPPVEVTGLILGAGGYLTFSGVTGATSYVGGCPGAPGGGCFPADGDVTGVTNYLGSSPGFINRAWAGYVGGENGISDVTAPLSSLIGVFLDNSQPDSTAAPGALDFQSASIGLDFSTLNPQLKQVFFIGDGMTSTSVVQLFNIPTGATRLYLGTMDGFGWTGNNGALDVTVTAVPVPAAVWLLGSGLLGLIGVARRKAA